MESRRRFAAPRTGALVCSVHDDIVRFSLLSERVTITHAL